MSAGRDVVGRIVRLQVQTASLKRGERPHRWYDPAPITPVSTLLLDKNGVRGVLDDVMLEDVHNLTHAESKFRADNGISIGFTSHYAAMRDRFGDHLADGLAGENILVATDGMMSLGALGSVLVIETREGTVEMAQISVATPCVEFSRFCLRYDRDRPADRTVTDALRFLDGGMRGYYAVTARSGTLRVDDVVFRTREYT